MAVALCACNGPVDGAGAGALLVLLAAPPLGTARCDWGWVMAARRRRCAAAELGAELMRGGLLRGPIYRRCGDVKAATSLAAARWARAFALEYASMS